MQLVMILLSFWKQKSCSACSNKTNACINCIWNIAKTSWRCCTLNNININLWWPHQILDLQSWIQRYHSWPKSNQVIQYWGRHDLTKYHYRNLKKSSKRIHQKIQTFLINRKKLHSLHKKLLQKISIIQFGYVLEKM